MSSTYLNLSYLLRKIHLICLLTENRRIAGVHSRKDKGLVDTCMYLWGGGSRSEEKGDSLKYTKKASEE